MDGHVNPSLLLEKIGMIKGGKVGKERRRRKEERNRKQSEQSMTFILLLF